MERVGALIKRLLEQYEEHAGADNLKLTAQMILNELQNAEKPATSTERKVVVIMPATKNTAGISTVQRQEPALEIIPVVEEKPSIEPEPVKEIIQEVLPAAVIPEPPVEEKIQETKPVPPANAWNDIPTFAYQQKEVYELNDSIAHHEESLNERLKTEKTELGSILKEAPVRDLRKAIGINDRFAFINELFRGDEIMYERSIKTINTFNILPEAEYWIQRELKLKIGWNEESETVQLFDQLVRRRFS